MPADRYEEKSNIIHALANRLFATTSITSSFGLALVVLGALTAGSALSPLHAQSAGMQPGEAYATRFSGAAGDAGPGIIDVNGVVGSIVDIRNPGFVANGSHWLNEPQHNFVTAGEVGQVYGIAIDDASPPNVYLTATSAFGLHLGADKNWMTGMWGPEAGPGTVYKLNGENDYQPEIFATITLDERSNSGAALGNIAFDKTHGQLFVSDMETGMIHRLSAADGSELGLYDHGVEGRGGFFDAVSGASNALEPVTFDPESTARINDCPAGEFSKTTSCWNVADFRRRVWGLGVHSARLYYAVWGSQGFGNSDWAGAGDDQNNTIWSIAIGADGALNRTDIRREFTVPGFFATNEDFMRAGGSHPVSDIAFSKSGIMLLAERGGMRNLGLGVSGAFAWPNESRILRFERDQFGSWQPTGRYDTGFYDRKDHGQPFLRAASGGGVDFGFAYTASGNIDLGRPDAFVWNTGDSLCSPAGPCFNSSTGTFDDSSEVHGLQGQPTEPPVELVPQSAYQPYPNPGPVTSATGSADAYMIDLHINVDASFAVLQHTLLQNDATHPGDVEIYKPVGDAYPSHLPPGSIHLPIGSFHTPPRSPHLPRGSYHRPEGSYHSTGRSPHYPRGSVHRPKGSFHMLPKSPHRPKGSFHRLPKSPHYPRGSVHKPRGSFHLLPKSPHRPRGSFHRLPKSPHIPRGSIHKPRGSFHLLPKSPHRPKGSFHRVPKSPHYPRGSVHKPKGSFHLLSKSPHRPKGSFHRLPKSPHFPRGSVHKPKGSFHLLSKSPHRPKGSFHRLPKSPHFPRGSVHKPKGSFHLLSKSPHRPKGSFHRVPKSPHFPRGSVHKPKGSFHLLSKSPHRPKGSVHRPKGSRIIPTHRPKGSFKIPARPKHNATVSRRLHVPARPVRPVHNNVVSRGPVVRPPIRLRPPKTVRPVVRKKAPLKSRVRPKVLKIQPASKVQRKVRRLNRTTGKPEILIIKPK